MKKNLGLRIKHFRELQGLTQEAMGKLVDSTKTTVYRWESGTSWPEYDKLEAICSALSITMDQLFYKIAETADVAEPTAEQLVSALSELFLDASFRKRLVGWIHSYKSESDQG